jgi:hypothetical protein
VKTWRGKPGTNSSGSDNLLAGVWALVSCKYSLFGVQHNSERDAIQCKGFAGALRFYRGKPPRREGGSYGSRVGFYECGVPRDAGACAAILSRTCLPPNSRPGRGPGR